MKQSILIVISIILLTGSTLFCTNDENDMITGRKVFLTGITGSYFSGVEFGIGREYTNPKRKTESYLMFHLSTEPRFSSVTGGISHQKNIFMTQLNTEGFFFRYNVGVDLYHTENWTNPFSGGHKRSHTIVIPRVSCGFGTSILLQDQTYLRLSTDIGIKILFASLNISLTF